MNQVVVAAGAAVGSTVGGFQGALIGAGVATTGIATYRVVKQVIFVGGVMIMVIKRTYGIVRRDAEKIQGSDGVPLFVGGETEQAGHGDGDEDEQWVVVEAGELETNV